MEEQNSIKVWLRKICVEKQNGPTDRGGEAWVGFLGLELKGYE